MSNKKIDIPLVIFAGGKSSRMGRDKSLLPFREYSTLTEYQLRRFDNEFDNIYISCKSKDKFDFVANYIEDCSDTYSPLVAIESIFDYLDCDSFVALSVDTPYISIDTLRLLIENNSLEYIATTAKSEYIEPLCTIYNRPILPIIKEAIASNHHKLMLLLKDANVVPISKDEFTNLNYHDDYLEAIKNK
jgi:molybdopterin-guanine dinucleotide biosynthesis protein A